MAEGLLSSEMEDQAQISASVMATENGKICRVNSSAHKPKKSHRPGLDRSTAAPQVSVYFEHSVSK
jgi:hypothetical protein